jgi:hypothetical protein
MRHEVETPPPGGDASEGRAVYEWRFGGRWNRLEARIAGRAELPPSGSEEGLVTEHYWGYTRQPDGGTLEYRVEHPPWRVWRATSSLLDCDAVELYGPAFADTLARPSYSAFVAQGSPVTVLRGTRIA